MSTTVTYKGSTLTTIENGTKYLLTAGKYMEDNVTITDVTGGGAEGKVYIIDELDENGGTIRELITDEDATITTSLDEHGGTIVSITATEIYLQRKYVTPTGSVQVITPDQGYEALYSVTVGAAEILPNGDEMGYGTTT